MHSAPDRILTLPNGETVKVIATGPDQHVFVDANTNEAWGVTVRTGSTSVKLLASGHYYRRGGAWVADPENRLYVSRPWPDQKPVTPKQREAVAQVFQAALAEFDRLYPDDLATAYVADLRNDLERNDALLAKLTKDLDEARMARTELLAALELHKVTQALKEPVRG